MKVLVYKFFTATVLLLSFVSLSFSQTLSKNSQDNITQIVSESLQEYSIPGAVALVTNGDKEIYSHAFGFSDVLNKKAMDVENIFRIASMTKPITSTGLMLLIEKGMLNLEDPMLDHLPDQPAFEIFDEFNFDDGTFSTKKAENAVTIKHLLTHTSGMAYNFNSFELAAASEPLFSRDRYLLQHEPGEKWTYGPSTNIVGDLIVEKSGKGLFEFFKEELFEPLGMEETFFDVPVQKSGRVVTIHQKIGSGFVEGENPEIISSPELGHGGLNSTASDYAKFMRLYLNNGVSDSGEQILLPETVELISSNHIGDLRAELQPASRPQFARPFPQGAGKDQWGLGFQLTGTEDEYQRSLGSMSWAGIFNTKFWIDRNANIAAVLLMQYLPFDDDFHLDVLSKFEEAVYRNLEL